MTTAEQEVRDWDLAVDVVVAGIGIAGGAAAITAHDLGASVLILEKEPERSCGGNSRVSGNCWFENLDENAAAAYLVSMSGTAPPPAEMVKVWATETARNSDWVSDLGVPISLLPGSEPPEFPELQGAEGYGGMNVVGQTWGMSRLWKAVFDGVARRGIEIRFGSPLTDLIIGDGAVQGAVSSQGGRPLLIRARRGVVLATGGFENNPDLIRDYLGVRGTVPWGSPANTGDGILIARKAGADLWHMDNYMPVLGLAAQGWRTGFHVAPERRGLVLVDAGGRRFANEYPPGGHGHMLIDGRYRLFPPPATFVVLDHETVASGPLFPPLERTPYSWNEIIERYRWSPASTDEVARGWLHSAPTIAGLGELLGIDGDALTKTIQQYNAACSAGTDAEFGRDPRWLVPITTPPFYGFSCPPIVGYTCGGPRRDEGARVVRPDGSPIPGLYSAGEVSSTYSWCMDGGMMIADALAFGRIAGRNAAQEAARLPDRTRVAGGTRC
jgi:succinate dehydrogenase/fumarate reductase flavoprotein subunit